MSEAADGLRRFADVVDALQETTIDIDSAQLLEAADDTIRGQLTVTVHDGDLDGSGVIAEPDDRTGDTGDPDETDVLDHTVTEDLERAYDEADGNISTAAERFEVGYGAVYRQMTNRGVHETNGENGTSTEDENESESESEAPDVDLEEDAADDAPAGTGDDVQANDEITVDGVDGEKDEPDIALPDGVTEADVQAATEDHEGLGDVANELGITRGRARAITVALDCYGDVRDIPGGRQ
ncbi:hypothetical protein [Halostagnicola sp. A-GB9-2]|uniref:hypothetical protein n=1 Tax=Halostagnicola sp. A-GB9-2 TaxID=3048066 RepID=UPI0024C0232F|nr:hypothetical protein [Halostagnicola sp. A-GB9-2]MDJ1433548.1 hypothetical protein [Halostagnicola sp. A-GB9-2]